MMTNGKPNWLKRLREQLDSFVWDEPRNRDEIIFTCWAGMKTRHLDGRVDHLRFELIRLPNPLADSLRIRRHRIEARRGAFIPRAEGSHISVEKKVAARVFSVDVDICPCVAQWRVRVRNVPRAVVIYHAVRYRIIKRNR
jgi:hypothetical protein